MMIIVIGSSGFLTQLRNWAKNPIPIPPSQQTVVGGKQLQLVPPEAMGRRMQKVHTEQDVLGKDGSKS